MLSRAVSFRCLHFQPLGTQRVSGLVDTQERAPTPAGLCVAMDKLLDHGVPQVICEVGVAVKPHWLGLGSVVSTRNSK